MRAAVLKSFLLKVGALLSAFLIGVCVMAVFQREGNPVPEAPCVNAPTTDSAILPCANADYSSLPILSYCDLIASPQVYEDKLVRLRIGYEYRRVGPVRRDDICQKQDPQFDIDIVAGASDRATQGLMKAWDAGLLPSNNIFVVAGRFRKNGPSGGGESKVEAAIYRFELLKIESVAAHN